MTAEIRSTLISIISGNQEYFFPGATKDITYGATNVLTNGATYDEICKATDHATDSETGVATNGATNDETDVSINGTTDAAASATYDAIRADLATNYKTNKGELTF